METMKSREAALGANKIEKRMPTIYKLMPPFYSRQYLQGIEKQIDILIAVFINDLKGAAASGEKMYLCDETLYQQYNLTKEVLLIAFKARFPGCIITYKEKSETGLLAGVLIDWS